MKEKVEFRKTREFGTLIGDTFLFIRQNFKPLMKCFFAICGIYLAAGVISMFLYKVQARDMAVAQPYNERSIFMSVLQRTVFNWQYFLMVLVSVVNYVSFYITIFSFITLYISKGNVIPTIDEIWGYYKYYFLRIFGVTILLTLFFIFCLGLCAFGGTAVGWPLGVLMFLVFMIGFIYVFPALTLLYPIMVIENGTFWYALGRSFKLIKSNWWSTAAVILIIFVIFYACTFILQIPAYALTMIGTISHLDGSVRNVFDAISSCFTSVSQLFLIVPLVCSALIYFNLVEQKESPGLLDRIGTLGQQKGPVDAFPEEY